ncbi:MAG TPA: PaaI family thioesterase [Terriglobales bacterium]|jgi:uncharacterized protein (TIGR00369 family)
MSAEGHATTAATLRVNECFGCGKGNPDGMLLDFRFEGEHTVCDFNLPKRYQGPPGHCHGGIIATILDEAMGKVNKLRQVVALTKSMEIEYLRPTPLYKDLRVVGWEEKVEGRAHINLAEIRNPEGDVLARSRGVFIAIDPRKMFKEHLPPADE